MSMQFLFFNFMQFLFILFSWSGRGAPVRGAQVGNLCYRHLSPGVHRSRSPVRHGDLFMYRASSMKHYTLLARRIFRWRLDFWKIWVPLFCYCVVLCELLSFTTIDLCPKCTDVRTSEPVRYTVPRFHSRFRTVITVQFVYTPWNNVGDVYIKQTAGVVKVVFCFMGNLRHRGAAVQYDATASLYYRPSACIQKTINK